jgi:hypothetical protein
MIRPADHAFIGALVWRFPELMDDLGEHLADNNRELLPHVFMASVEKWAESLLEGRTSELEALLNFLADGVAGGLESVQNLIDVSFVENLPYPDEPTAAIRAMLPAELRSLLRHGIEPESE